jgi:HlyD family secretion protein
MTHHRATTRNTKGFLCRALSLLAFALALLIVPMAGCQQVEEAPDDAIRASGFIEGDHVTVAPATDGRIVEIAVQRGDAVEAGQVVVRLDDRALRSQQEEAEAGLAAARANLELVREGAREAEVAAARAGVSEAEALVRGAEEARLHAREVISNPQALEHQIHEAQTQVQLAEQGVEQAEAQLAATELKRDVYAERGGDVATAWNLQVQAAEATLTEAQANLQGAVSYLSALRAMQRQPLALAADLHRAASELKLAQARLEVEEAALAALAAGPSAEAVTVAEAQVRRAERAVGVLDARLDHLTLTAPMAGIVSRRSAQVGETATAGTPILTLVDLDEVTLVLYIPVDRIGQVQVGQAVAVTVDAYPERTFPGEVTSIAGEAEFTPRNVQTQAERVNLVFAVKVRLPNPDRALKLGMPADATIEP